MGKMRKRSFERDYVQIPNETAKAVEAKSKSKHISLGALGLITNLWSYNVEAWELHKTELYKRYEFSKEKAVSRMWTELVEANYIVEFKVFVNKKWDFIYYYNPLPYTDEEKEILLDEAQEEFGNVWNLKDELLRESLDTTEDCVSRTSKRGPQNEDISNKELKKDTTKEIKTKDKDIVNKEDVNKKSIINIANEFYNEFAVTRWSKEQWNRLINKIADEILNSEKTISDHAAYMYAVLKNVAYKHDLKYGKIESPENLVNSSIPFYNWLEDDDDKS